MTREEARRDINKRPLTDFVPLEKSPKAGRDMFVCPICGSGRGKNKTGALRLYVDSCRVQCFASSDCFTEKGQDTIGALRAIWKCTETEALTRAGYSIEHQKHQGHTEHQEHKDHTLFYRQCHQALKESPEALEYLRQRGITDESIERFNLGYCAAWKHSAAPKAEPTKRIIIPRTPGTYTARRIDKPRNEWEEAYTKQIQGRQKDLFNLEALEGDTPFICEGELDAVSLIQAGASSVVAIGTTTNAGRLLDEAKKHPEAVFVLALDNDPDKEDGRNPGKEAQRKLAADMKAAGLDVLNVDPADIYGTAKDGNEAFTKDPERLGKAIAYLEGKAREMKAARDEERQAELRKRTGEGMLEDFLLSVQEKTYEPIPTGISDIDRALEGGFLRGTLCTLGAMPGMGKTALLQWILENMASAGHDVLFLNLEMSRPQLIARSISRTAWKYGRHDLTALEVLRGYEWTEEQRDAITAAAARYKAEIAPHFVYNPDGVDNSIDSILQAMEAETARIKAQGRPAPLVAVDYLQLIDGGEKDPIEGMKHVIFRLKDFAKKENTVVFLITANNRASNRSGTVEMESGRDTSAIEYSGDCMLGLSYTAIEDREKLEDGKGTFDLDTIRRMKKDAYEAGKPVPAVCNQISLKVLKNRFTDAERRVKLIFDGKHSTFHLQARDGWEHSQGRTPFD